jgi:hypothetical protein
MDSSKVGQSCQQKSFYVDNPGKHHFFSKILKRILYFLEDPPKDPCLLKILRINFLVKDPHKDSSVQRILAC